MDARGVNSTPGSRFLVAQGRESVGAGWSRYDRSSRKAVGAWDDKT